MAVRSYEIMFLLDSGKYATDPDGVTKEVHAILEKIGAEVISARPWMDGKLAYPIEGHRKGLHYLAFVKADSNNVQQLQRLCKLSSVVLRYLCLVPPAPLFDIMSSSLMDGPAEASHEEAEAAQDVEIEEEEASVN
ncbi:MAG: 30S ribosomal protein S6 [Planctomycetaceae bacterium]|nr:30S ribosomal protein S6 [Planctomycetaceae bacterium]